MLKFRIYHLWLQGIFQTSLLRTWLISVAKAFLLTTTMTLNPKISVPKNITLPQLEEENIWILEGIICPRQSKHLHNTNAGLKNFYHEEVMKMKKLEKQFILFPVEYLK